MQNKGFFGGLALAAMTLATLTMFGSAESVKADDEKSAITINFDGETKYREVSKEDGEAIKEAFGYYGTLENLLIVGNNTSGYIDWSKSEIPFWKIYNVKVFQPVMSRDFDGKLKIDLWDESREDYEDGGLITKGDEYSWTDYYPMQYTDPSDVEMDAAVCVKNADIFSLSDNTENIGKNFMNPVDDYRIINNNLHLDKIRGYKGNEIDVTDAYIIRFCYTTDDKMNYMSGPRLKKDVNGNEVDLSDWDKECEYNADRTFGFTDFWILPEGKSTVLNLGDYVEDDEADTKENEPSKPDDTKTDDSKKEDTKIDESATVDTYTGLRKESGSWYYYNSGKYDASYTGLCKNNGSWWYVKNGKVDFSATTLCKYNGAWFYVKGGKVDFSATTLCKYNGTWFYVKNGKVDFGATTLCKYNGSWFYVKNGKVDFSATTLCKYNGSWFYVKGGKVDFNATTLCKYNGSWWYVKGGKIDFKSTTLCKYNGTWFYVNGGKVNFGANGLCKYNGVWWYIKNGSVSFTNTLCKFNGTWWYINNGAVNFNKTTLVKYGNNWYAAAGGKVAWGYTGNLKYNGGTYRVVNGVVKF